MHSAKVILVCLAVAFTTVTAQCPSGSCVCDTPSGRIDLTTLVRPGAFSYSTTSGDFTYYYNLCGSVVSYGECSYDAAVCQVSNVDGSVYTTGLKADEQIIIEGDTKSIKYTGGDGDRLSIIELVCDESATEAEFTFFGEFIQLQYEFQLRTRCACYDKCEAGTTPPPGTGSDGPPPNDDGKGSGNIVGVIGIVLIAGAILAIVTYFVVGGVILHVKFQKRRTEVIPQNEFWLALPFLVKDGFIFTFSPIYYFIKGKMSGRGSYETVK